MELTHNFTVPAPVDETWAAFQDIESVAGCFPGATVTEVEGDEFKGSCKVKLGPIALVYTGSGKFVEKDDAARRFVVEAKGKDRRGNGTAGATVTATMGDRDGSTEVTVVTDLAITGKPAQFGRGIMQDVSDKLLGQFVECLKQQVGGGPVAAAPPPRASGSVGAPATGSPEPAVEAIEPAGAESPPDDRPDEPPLPHAPAHRTPAGSGATGLSAPRPTAPRAQPQQDDALDLGATVVPILARTYWKQALGGLAVLAFIFWWIKRR